MTGIPIRDLRGMDEYLAAERLQVAVWGPGDKTDPADLMMVIAEEGGLACGAFRGDDLLGYLFAFPTRDPRIQHSHRLATHPQARGLGLAAALKWHQRDWCLQRGIDHVRWTFDPLRPVNASLNIARLGATSATYLPDYYGAMAGINEGLPSDRVLADWHLASDRVAARAAGEPVIALAGGHAVPVGAADDPTMALASRMALRHALTATFADGFRIGGYDAETRRYLLDRA